MSWHLGRLLVELDGSTVPLDDCTWVLLRPCLCLAAAAPASSDLASADAAWRHFFAGTRRVHREVDYAKRHGYGVELRDGIAPGTPLFPPAGACPHGRFQAHRKRTVPAGTRYGRLIVIADRQPGEDRVVCRCDCGNEVSVGMHSLDTGETRSCGCLRRDVAAARSRKHGMCGTSEYDIWAAMVQRTTNPNNAAFANYGGRGIGVCDRWREFANFFADMGPRPEGLTLERIDNERGYSPENCKWATYSEQRHNRRDTTEAVR